MDYFSTYKEMISPLFKTEITNENMVQIAAYFYRESHKLMVRANTSDYPKLPNSLRLGKDFFDVLDYKALMDINSRFLSMFPNIFTFIRVVFHSVFFDFSLAEEAFNKLKFNNNDAVREFVLIFVLYLQQPIKDEHLLLDTLKDELKLIKRDKLLNQSIFNDILAAHRGYYLCSKNNRVLPNNTNDEDVTAAYDSIDILKNELKISSVLEQMMVVADYYDGSNSALKLFRCISKKSYQFLDQSNRDQQHYLLRCCYRLCRVLKFSSPHQILEAFYQKKKNSAVDSNRDNGSLIECSLMYHRFSSRLDPSKSVLLVFPSPYFIRKYYSDPLTKDIKTVIVVPSQAEKRLWVQDKSEYERNNNISFYTLDEFIGENTIQFINVIVVNSLPDESTDFNTRMNNTLGSLCDYLCKKYNEAQIYCFCSEKSFSNPDFFSYNFIRNNKEIRSILFLPNETKRDTCKKKLFWLGWIKEYSGSVRCYGSYLKKNGDKTILESNKEEIGVFDSMQFYKTILAGRHYSIKSFIKKNNTSPSNTTRNKPISFEVTPEISIFYTVHYPKNYPQKVDVRAYFKQKSLVPGTEVFKRLDKDKINEWLKNGYLFEEICKGKQVSTKVRNVIAPIIQEQKAGLPLSLKTFIYIYPEIGTQFSEEQYKILEELAYKSDIGNTSMASITEEVLSEASLGKYDIDEVLELFSFVFDYAKNKGHLDYNLLNDEIDDSSFSHGYYSRLILSSVRSKLSKKTFTNNEFKDFFKRVINKIETEHDIRYIAVLLKSLTGLEASPISVLQWRDFHKIEKYGVYQLDIYKYQIKPSETNDGEQFELFINDSKFRCIPCCQTLSRVLLEEKKRRNVEPDDYIFSEDGKTPIAHKEITRTFKQILNDMNLPQIAEQTINEETLALSDYGGDFLRENFRFHASDRAKLTNDEIAYLLGNVPPTTFGQYYCDFFNPAAQYLLMTKLNRLDAMLTKEERFEIKDIRQGLEGNHNYSFESKTSVYPIQLNIVGKNNSKNESLELVISSDFGFKYFIQQGAILK